MITLLFALTAFASINANEAATIAIKANRNNAVNAAIYKKIRASAKLGNYMTNISLSCNSLSFLEADGFKLDYASSSSCFVQWKPKVIQVESLK
jgi:hypothetical protein